MGELKNYTVATTIFTESSLDLISIQKYDVDYVTTTVIKSILFLTL